MGAHRRDRLSVPGRVSARREASSRSGREIIFVVVRAGGVEGPIGSLRVVGRPTGIGPMDPRVGRIWGWRCPLLPLVSGMPGVRWFGVHCRKCGRGGWWHGCGRWCPRWRPWLRRRAEDVILRGFGDNGKSTFFPSLAAAGSGPGHSDQKMSATSEWKRMGRRRRSYWRNLCKEGNGEYYP